MFEFLWTETYEMTSGSKRQFVLSGVIARHGFGEFDVITK